jgi:hypothetical protein
MSFAICWSKDDGTRLTTQIKAASLSFRIK